MAKAKVKKVEKPDEDDSNPFAIMCTLINAEEPMTLSEISKEVDIPTNLVFYHLKALKDQYLVLETDDKYYYCQPVFKGGSMEDLDALMMILIKMIVKEIITDAVSERELGKAVLANLRLYLQMFELTVE